MAKNIGMTVMGKKDALFSGEEDVNLVQDAYDRLGLVGSHTATVGGEPATLDHVLNDNDFVVFAKATKGGQQ